MDGELNWHNSTFQMNHFTKYRYCFYFFDSTKFIAILTKPLQKIRLVLLQPLEILWISVDPMANKICYLPQSQSEASLN